MLKNNKRAKGQNTVADTLYVTLKGIHSVGNEMIILLNWFHKNIKVLV